MSKKRDRKKKRAQAVAAEERKSHASEYGTTYYRDMQVMRSTRSNRFMFARYSSAFLFFLNLSWSVILLAGHSWGIVVPLVGMLSAGVAIVECMVEVTKGQERLKWTERLYPISVALNVVAAVVTAAVSKDVFAPFLSEPLYGVILCLVCIAVELLVIRHLVKVRNHTDRRYKYYAKISAGDL